MTEKVTNSRIDVINMPEAQINQITITPGASVTFQHPPINVGNINNGLGAILNGIENIIVPFTVTAFDDHLEVTLQGNLDPIVEDAQ